MRKTTLSYFILFLLITVACQPTIPLNTVPTDRPFPTATFGQRLAGRLNTPQAAFVQEANPATAAAIAVRPTATPNTSACPSPARDVTLGTSPTSRNQAINSILRFLNSGGSAEALRTAMIAEWDVFGDEGYLRADTDLTGEGQVEIVMGYAAPGDVGTLLILGCENGRYVQLYETIADGIAPPRLVWLGEINNDLPAEVIFARQQCRNVEVCEFQTQIIGWSVADGGLVNLLAEPLFTLDVPDVRDFDSDSVIELIVNLDNNGTAATGPLRTGTNIYDWNGELYVLSRIQLNPPRYRIQVVHEGDRLFSQLEMQDALRLYDLALDDDDLRYWFNDGPVTVISYALYRQILAYAYLGDGAGIIETLTQVNDTFPLEEGETQDDMPVYVQMANIFVNRLQETNDLNSACQAVQAIIDERDEALGFINRYGVRSPTYTALDLCPY